MKHLLRYFIIRVTLTIPMVFILLTIVFVVLRVMPGDPITALMGVHARPDVVAAQRTQLGLDKPMAVQYFHYLWKVVRLDFGKSIIFKEDVAKTIFQGKLPATLELSFSSMIVALILGVWAGATAADKRKSPQDYTYRLMGIVVYCIPIYWLGLMFQLVFGAWLDWLPIAGRTGPRVFSSDFDHTGFYIIDTILVADWQALGDVLTHLIMPAVTDGLIIAAVFLRITRANMLDILKSDYIVAASARGIRHGRIVYKLALKNAFVPILTMLGLIFAILMAGSVLVEVTFSWPGMGRLLMESVFLRDYPVIQGVIIIYAFIVAMVSLAVDLIYALVDPRVRF